MLWFAVSLIRRAWWNYFQHKLWPYSSQSSLWSRQFLTCFCGIIVLCFMLETSLKCTTIMQLFVWKLNVRLVFNSELKSVDRVCVQIVQVCVCRIVRTVLDAFLAAWEMLYRLTFYLFIFFHRDSELRHRHSVSYTGALRNFVCETNLLTVIAWNHISRKTVSIY